MHGMHGVVFSWLVTGNPAQAPIRNGALVLDSSDKILAIGEHDVLARNFAGVAFQALQAVGIPGLCNAHTHLELTALQDKVPACTAASGGFVRWVRELQQARARFTDSEIAAGIDHGIAMLKQSGTVAVGEVTNSGMSVQPLAESHLHAAVFHEVYGAVEERGRAMHEAARARIAGWQTLAFSNAHVLQSIAPHSLYGLHAEVIREIARDASMNLDGRRISIHLAEHTAEREWLESSRGPLKEYLRSVGVQTDRAVGRGPRMGPVQYAAELGLLNANAILVHLTDAYANELEEVGKSSASVVLCPRSNVYIEGRLPLVPLMLAAGIRPGLGTDSLASNHSLDVIQEAQVLHEAYPEVPARVLIAMLTSWGAAALGVDDIVGTLEVGKAPGVLLVRHGEQAPDDPERFVLRSHAADRRLLQSAALT